jgi:uncharacterized protein (DUF4415 family)
MKEIFRNKTLNLKGKYIMYKSDPIIEAIFDEKEIEKWDSRELGADEKYAKRAVLEKSYMEAIDGGKEDKPNSRMQLISIRLPETLIQDLKNIGKKEELGYQTLIREIMKRFVAAEQRKELNQTIAENEKLRKEMKKMEELLEKQA